MKEKRNTRKKKKEEMNESVHDFFDKNAVFVPDQKLVSRKSGKARKVVDKPIKDLHAAYVQEGGKAAFSTFAKCRPRCQKNGQQHIAPVPL